jgi:DHA2 family multidrug resistance protein
MSIPTLPPATNTPQLSARLIAALTGMLIAAILAGLNNRVGALALADMRGVLSLSLDDASWLTTAYSAGELIAMPFAAWFAITFSMRRLQLWVLGICAVLAFGLPWIHNLDVLLALRFAHGVVSGTMIPLLMMAALKFLPPGMKLQGLALYALTATFAPNLSVWLAGLWVDGLFDWRWVYWQIIPLAALAAFLVAWGLPSEPIQVERFRQGNWFGMACGVPGLALIVIALDQGVRLDWFHSPLITLALVSGLALMTVYLLTEWHHPGPFIKLQMLGRRNLGLGFSVFLLLVIVMTSGVLLPMNYLGALQDYRPIQMASIGLIIALPQLVLGPLIALFLSRKWVDARKVFGLGLLLMALACLFGAQLTADWNRDQFVRVQILQTLGQPMSVVSMLFLGTGVVHPSEGAYVSGTINALRALGSLLGGTLALQIITVRSRFHAEMLLDFAAQTGRTEVSGLANIIGQQSLVLAIADTYRVLGLLAVLLIPVVLCLTYIPAPSVAPSSPSEG